MHACQNLPLYKALQQLLLASAAAAGCSCSASKAPDTFPNQGRVTLIIKVTLTLSKCRVDLTSNLSTTAINSKCNKQKDLDRVFCVRSAIEGA